MALHLVPCPQSVHETGPGVTLPPIVPVVGTAEEVQTLRTLLGEGAGLTLVQVDGAAGPSDGSIMIRIGHGDHSAGGYSLVTDASGVRITTADRSGLINAVQTLRQLMPTWAYGLAPLPDAELTLPGVEIDDAPELAWRGVHLDVARHFAPFGWLLQFVDLLALHKINIFHLHLTEDQGWRFEVKKYPKLTEVACWRHGTRNPDWDTDDQVPHGGFYTQDQLRSLVAYANARGITVVPEIDLPGHVVALLTAYPEYGELHGGEIEVQRTWGVFDQVLHLTDSTVGMIEDVFTELLDVFDSEWIHVGGDECPHTQWRNSDAAQRLAASRGLPSVDHLQRWLTEHLREWLAERGRRLVGWDEIIDEAEVPGAVVMSWRGTEPGLRAIAAGNEVVMAPGDPLYFDHYQSDAATEPRAIGGHLPWQKVIAFDPYAGITDAQRGSLLGIQAQLWSEYLPSPRQVEYMAFPRVSAMAEVAWRGGPMRPDAFEPALRAQVERLEARGVNVRPLDGAHPWQQGGGRYARHIPEQA